MARSWKRRSRSPRRKNPRRAGNPPPWIDMPRPSAFRARDQLAREALVPSTERAPAIKQEGPTPCLGGRCRGGRGRLQARNSQVTRMCRTLSVVSWLGVFLLIASLSHAQDKPALKDALALQEAIQDAIAAAERAVACIIVSRSERYAQVGQGPPDPSRGMLGEYRSPEPHQGRFGAPLPDKDQKLDLANSGNVPESYGSGVVIEAQQGLILTNRHVVLDAAKLYVRLPSGKGSYANIHAADPRSDLAVVKLIKPPADWKAIKLGDGGKVRKGQFVVALANPFAAGFKDGSPSASWGIISNIRRRAPGNPKEEKE